MVNILKLQTIELNNMTRQEVYKLIDGEREYQDSFIANPKNNRSEGVPHQVAGYIVMLNHYVQKLNEEWTGISGTDAALHVIRKIAGIAVHCMEDHGAPERKQIVK